MLGKWADLEEKSNTPESTTFPPITDLRKKLTRIHVSLWWCFFLQPPRLLSSLGKIFMKDFIKIFLAVHYQPAWNEVLLRLQKQKILVFREMAEFGHCTLPIKRKWDFYWEKLIFYKNSSHVLNLEVYRCEYLKILKKKMIYRQLCP